MTQAYRPLSLAFHPESNILFPSKKLKKCVKKMSAYKAKKMKLEDFLQKIEVEGARFSISLEKSELRLNGKEIKDFVKSECLNIQDFVKKLEEYYEDYRYSLPSERSDRKRKNYFIALPEDELTDEQMFFGMPREIARFRLEFLCLSQKLGGWEWNEEELGKWYFKSQNIEGLVILRQWFENKSNN